MKLAIYAICKNEEKFVVNWILNALSTDADYICVLDTGSTDETYTILQDWATMCPDRLRISQKIIEPWRFDVARNESMSLIPDDTDWWLCIDLDELIMTTSIKPLIEKVFTITSKPLNTIYYLYNWGNNRIFWYDKLHRYGVPGRWTGAVHEGFQLDGQVISAQLNHVLVEHHPDQEKSRSSYLGLLEIRASENPDDIMSWVYLMLEYTYHEWWEKALQVCKDHLLTWAALNIKSDLSKYIFYYTGKCYRQMENYSTALAYLDMAAQQGSYEARLEKAEIYLLRNEDKNARHEMIEMMFMLDKGVTPNHFWMELVNSTTYQFNNRLGDVVKKLFTFDGDDKL